MIKLIATDMDGTLLDSNKNIPEDFKGWVSEHPEIKTVIASGRQYYNLRKQFSDMTKDMLFIADNGALVFENDKIIFVDEMDKKRIISVIKMLESEAGVHLILSGVESAYMLPGDEVETKNAKMYYERLEIVDDLYECVNRDKIVKIAIFKKDQAEELFDRITVADDNAKLLSGADWIDIQNKRTNKGEAIEAIQKQYNISRDETMVFGDYLNDRELILSAEESYAMGNAHDEIKEIAKHIAKTNDQNGVMEVLYTLEGRE